MILRKYFVPEYLSISQEILKTLLLHSLWYGTSLFYHTSHRNNITAWAIWEKDTQSEEQRWIQSVHLSIIQLALPTHIPPHHYSGVGIDTHSVVACVSQLASYTLGTRSIGSCNSGYKKKCRPLQVTLCVSQGNYTWGVTVSSVTLRVCKTNLHGYIILFFHFVKSFFLPEKRISRENLSRFYLPHLVIVHSFWFFIRYIEHSEGSVVCDLSIVWGDVLWDSVVLVFVLFHKKKVKKWGYYILSDFPVKKIPFSGDLWIIGSHARSLRQPALWRVRDHRFTGFS